MRMGRTDVKRMLRGMSARELKEWWLYAQLDPFDDLRADYRAASIAAVIANVNRDPKTRPEPYTYDDMRIKYETGEGETKPKTGLAPWELQKNAFIHMALQQNAAEELREDALKRGI